MAFSVFGITVLATKPILTSRHHTALKSQESIRQLSLGLAGGLFGIALVFQILSAVQIRIRYSAASGSKLGLGIQTEAIPKRLGAWATSQLRFRLNRIPDKVFAVWHRKYQVGPKQRVQSEAPLRSVDSLACQKTESEP